jgi:hypothetical protein
MSMEYYLRKRGLKLMPVVGDQTFGIINAAFEYIDERSVHR